MCVAHVPSDPELRDRIVRFNARFFLIFKIPTSKLAILGFALAKDRSQFLSAAYLLAIVAMLFYQVRGATGCRERESRT